jgi:hypothetical protein
MPKEAPLVPEPTEEEVLARQDQAVEYCIQQLANGGTVLAVAKELGVEAGALRHWIVRKEETYKRYAAARELQGTTFAERAIELANAATNKTVGVARLQVDTYRWFASRANPREWGDKQLVETSGEQTLRVVVEEDGGAPMEQTARATAVMSQAVGGTLLSLPAPESL